MQNLTLSNQKSIEEPKSFVKRSITSRNTAVKKLYLTGADYLQEKQYAL